jgi:hypothetical protein
LVLILFFNPNIPGCERDEMLSDDDGDDVVVVVVIVAVAVKGKYSAVDHFLRFAACRFGLGLGLRL